MGTSYDIPRYSLTEQDIKDLTAGKEINFGDVIIHMQTRPQITDNTAEQVKFLLKTTIEETMKIEEKDDRMKLLPHILDGIDLFDLKR